MFSNSGILFLLDVDDEVRFLFLGCDRRDGGWQSRLRIQANGSGLHGPILFHTGIQGPGVQIPVIFTSSIQTSRIFSSCLLSSGLLSSCLQSSSLYGPSSFLLQKIILLGPTCQIIIPQFKLYVSR
jgi:hypothetical protein